VSARLVNPLDLLLLARLPDILHLGIPVGSVEKRGPLTSGGTGRRAPSFI
jgi:hypothetical protein